METIRNLNNHGASLLSAGESQPAMIQFSSALKLLKQSIGNLKNAALDLHRKEGGPDFTLDECMVQSCRQTPGMAEAADDNQISSLYAYQHATLIPNDVAPTEGNAMTLSIIVIFNSALAHQQHANEVGASAGGSQLMAKAIKLYEYAFTLHQDGATCATSGGSGNPFFLIALMNNLALAKHAVQDVVACEQCLRQMLSILMFLVDTGSHTEYSSLCDGFLRNICHLVSPHVTAPAA